MSRDLGRDVPDLKKLYARNFGLIFRTLFRGKSNYSKCPVVAVLSVLKRCVPKTLAFAFGLRLGSKTRCFKTRVLGRRLPNGKPQERLRFRDLRSKTLAFKKSIAIAFCDLWTSLGARACVQVLCVQKTRRFAFAFLSPLRPGRGRGKKSHDNFRQFLTRHDNFVHATEFVIKRHKSVIKCHDNFRHFCDNL